MARVGIFFSALVAALVLAASASAAAPNYILVSGPGLVRAVLLDDWNENGELLSAMVNAPRAKRAVVRGLVRRPRLDLAEFWGWSDLPRPTRPSQANQHGWFYPFFRGRPPVVTLMVDGLRVPRLAPESVLQILTRHGIPTHLG
jgi:hypothetical protein